LTVALISLQEGCAVTPSGASETSVVISGLAPNEKMTFINRKLRVGEFRKFRAAKV
jgi:hypothetical protein